MNAFIDSLIFLVFVLIFVSARAGLKERKERQKNQ